MPAYDYVFCNIPRANANEDWENAVIQKIEAVLTVAGARFTFLEKANVVSVQ